MRRVWLFLALVFISVFPSVAEAQKNCSKGKPCGNSCIYRDKVCRIGTPSPAPANAPAAQPLTTAAVADAQFVASSRGKVYYLVGCSGAKKLSPANLIYFKTEKQAQDKGYRRSATKGC